MKRHTLNNGTEIIELISGTEPIQGSKFIGQTTDGQFIIATIFNDNSYGWTTYGNSLSGVMNAHAFKNRADNMDAHIERLDSALAEAVDCLESIDCINDEYTRLYEVIDLAEQLRGLIND